MRYEPIKPELFISNRNKLKAHLLPNSLVVLNSNDIFPKNGDGTMAFKQNSDLFYLSGINQEETILVLYPDAKKNSWKEALFIKETNEHIKIWEGNKLTKEEAANISSIPNVYWLHEFDQIFHNIMFDADNVYLNTNEHRRASAHVETRDSRFVNCCKQKYPLHNYCRLAPIMASLRTCKNEIEIGLIKKAADITAIGFKSIMSMIKSGVMEYELEAEMLYTFIKNRSMGFAYEPIIACGKNSCVLHYTSNNMRCNDGEIILFDVAAEYANYNSDVTRVLPVNRRFSARQKAVYNSVLHILRQVQTLINPTNTLDTYQKEASAIVEQELVNLGLISMSDIKRQDEKTPAYKKYFMHGLSHHLGLDVHDLADNHSKFKTNMVLTIEPGIYIQEEGFGIRLEDNFVIRENGLENLTKSIPIEIEELEEYL